VHSAADPHALFVHRCSHCARRNVGLFRYYELRQIPNFLFALPAWSLSAYGIWTYARGDLDRFLTLGLRASKASGAHPAEGRRVSESGDGASIEQTRARVGSAAGFLSTRALVYVYLWSALMAICVTVLHGQSLACSAARVHR
jgi:hypothetical protein